MSEISKVWFDQAKNLDIGEAIYVRVTNKKEQISIANDFEEEREQFSKIDSVHASQIFVSKVLKDMKQYVVLERKYRAPFTAFFRDSEGDFSKVSVDPIRKRTIKLMKKDGKSQVDIEDLLNGLTEEELEEFFPN